MTVSMVAPFAIVGGSVAYTTDLIRQTEQKILNVLVTGKTERSGRAQYGAGVQHLIFDNVEELEFTDWKIDASEEISKNVAGVSIIDIRVEVVEDTTATVIVYYRTPLSSPRAAVYSLPLNSILTEESPL